MWHVWLLSGLHDCFVYHHQFVKCSCSVCQIFLIVFLIQSGSVGNILSKDIQWQILVRHFRRTISMKSQIVGGVRIGSVHSLHAVKTSSGRSSLDALGGLSAWKAFLLRTSSDMSCVPDSSVGTLHHRVETCSWWNGHQSDYWFLHKHVSLPQNFQLVK